MLQVTDKARARLSEILSNHPSEFAMRIVRKGGRTKMRLASPRSDDDKFDHNGRVVLVLAKRVSSHFSDGTLDLRETNRGPKLHIRKHPSKRTNDPRDDS